jgi:hypothetical protein
VRLCTYKLLECLTETFSTDKFKQIDSDVKIALTCNYTFQQFAHKNMASVFFFSLDGEGFLFQFMYRSVSNDYEGCECYCFS